MLNKVQAVGQWVWVKREEPESEKLGFVMPESNKKSNLGIILSVGEEVVDKNIKKERTAIFNPQAGQTLEFMGEEVTILNGNQQILGVL